MGGKSELDGGMGVALRVPNHGRDEEAHVWLIQDKRLLDAADGLRRDDNFAGEGKQDDGRPFMGVLPSSNSFWSKICPEDALHRKRHIFDVSSS